MFAEQYAREISTWVEDDDVFLESHNFQAILEQVKLQSYITFVGVPGSGKTATYCSHSTKRRT